MFEIHPRKLEEVVESIFRDCGFITVLTGATHDKGIDIFMIGPDSEDIIGVQIKRSGRKIGAHPIQALFGAAVMRNATKALF